MMNQENEFPRRRKYKKIPTERVYIHKACREATLVNGEDFEVLANPFYIALKTYCVHCRKMVSLKSVVWADTEESLSNYRKRMLKRIPQFWHYWRKGLGSLIAGMIVAILAALLKPDDGMVAVISGFISGAICLPIFFPTYLILKYLGFDFRCIR